MIAILLTILKVLGILLLILLLTVLTLLFLVLFVPLRYRVRICRKEGEGKALSIEARVSWLLHLVNASFCYPEAAFLRVRVLGFTLFRSDKAKIRPDQSPKAPLGDTEKGETKKQEKEPQKTKAQKKPQNQRQDLPETGHKEQSINTEEGDKRADSGAEAKTEKEGFFSRVKEFFRKLLSLFQNIRYTIAQICDKIKHIVNNIQYYLNILKSDTFRRAWSVCSGQALCLLKSILPGKWTGSLVIGAGDPAGTGEILAVYGMLYPLLGNHISVTPDFERKIVEGELLIKGKITVMKGLKTAWKIYFNKDLRRLIKLFKREAA